MTTNLSDRYTCSDCGGRLRVVDEGNTDASAWEQHECVDCGGEGEFYISEGDEARRRQEARRHRTELRLTPMIRSRSGHNRPEGCVCLADQYERHGHRDYCDEQATLSRFRS
jgi:hypothetical protein